MKLAARLSRKVGKEAAIASREVLDGVVEILKADMQEDVKDMRSRDKLSSNNYSELIADHLATQRTYEKVIELLTIKGGS